MAALVADLYLRYSGVSAGTDVPKVYRPYQSRAVTVPATSTFMLDERSLKLDLVALLLCALVIFLAVALMTYDAADPLPRLIAPLNNFYVADSLVTPRFSICCC